MLLNMHNSKIFLRYCSRHAKPQRFSELLQTKESVPKENVESPTTCKSFKLMLQHGLITPSSPGIFNLMPLAVLSLEKLTTVLDSLMKSIQGQKVLLPTLALSSLWKTSGRWHNPNSQLFKLNDKHRFEYCLGPTHEEAVTSMLSKSQLSLKKFPLRLYQISTKFRDEIKPKLGLLRGREFIMKDMYTFDTSEENAQNTYNDVCTAYDKFFEMLGVKYVKVHGSSAGMGGNMSHEYHFLSDVGEDEIYYCPKCDTGFNAELSDGQKTCSGCGMEFQKSTGIEVGHAFLLGTAYSEPFGAKFKAQDGSARVLQMGCYGLGVTRILAASIECLSNNEQIRWPTVIAPCLMSIVPPKKGSKEEKASPFASFLYETLSGLSFLSKNIILDDRTNLTIGRRIQDANALGINYVLVAGSSVLQDVPHIEVIDNYNGKNSLMTHSQVMEFFRTLNDSFVLKYSA